MYHWIVRRRVLEMFRHLNAGDLSFIVKQFSPRAEHWFSGSHALSGRRSRPESIAAWYRRLAAVFPRIHFDIKKIVSSGPPWATRVAVEWVDSFPAKDALAGNEGVFFVTLSWGRIVEFHVFCDTDVLQQNLQLLGEQGVSEAVAAPIADLPLLAQ
jgi:ketosteroid isomerase-like protein